MSGRWRIFFNQFASGGGRINMHFFVERPIGERLNARSDLCVFWWEPCQHPWHAIMALDPIVSRTSWGHSSVAPDNRHCKQ